LWISLLACLLCLAGAWFFWHQENGRDGSSTLRSTATEDGPSRPHTTVAPAVQPHPPSTAANPLTAASTNAVTSVKTNKFAFRLSNTTKSLDQLVGDRHAILLENALIDTGSPLNLSIPTHLQSQGDPGTYIVQARGPIDNAFRAMLAAAGAEIVSYIPNNAYLVRTQAGMANSLAANSLVQAVIPYEPYYKIQSSLLASAVADGALPPGMELNLGLFANDAPATVAEIKKLGATILSQGRSPFGPTVQVQLVANWTALVTLPGVQRVEVSHARVQANDLSRAKTGVTADTQTATNYANLTGNNVLVEVNDSGIDANHPDLLVIGDSALSLVDTNGHGTHVAGIIAGSGQMSTTVSSAPGSILATNGFAVAGQFRGKAPAAKLFSVAALNNNGNKDVSDQYLQETPARTNALISNNSWNYGGDEDYDLAAASYDAAVRDALPLVTGSQPVLFVFSAGNSGGGDNDGSGGTADTILSPATAKNVITVGALEQLRAITNVVTKVVDGVTNTSTPWQPVTDSSFQVAGNSSRGNVGVGTEGKFGRYKPDVVAPGTFVLSTRSGQWDEISYYNNTNYSFTVRTNQVVDTNFVNYYSVYVPENGVGAIIRIMAEADSPSPFPNLPIYVSLNDYPNPADPATYDFVTYNNVVSIPPDSGGNITDITSVQGLGFNYAIASTNSAPVAYSLLVEIIKTNNVGDYFQVLSNLNDSLDGDIPPHYYRYESGTSISAADVSGVLALMQEFFTDPTYGIGITPSPALLKALLINGARVTGYYDFQVQNTINYEGWGLVNLSNSLPAGITNQWNAACASFYLDQSPTNALATGGQHTYQVSIVDTNASSLPLRITLAWTDPPGDPAAAIKLVNDLNLVVTNLDTGAVYLGNDIASGNKYNSAWDTNASTVPNLDSINNVENVYLAPGTGTNFSVAVQGYRVNVNAVTAHPDDVVQDFALVISYGNGEVTNAFTVIDNGVVSNPTTDQLVTSVTNANSEFLYQHVGASTPLLGTNQVLVGTNNQVLVGTNIMVWTGTNSVITIGMTNQWHFYVVKNPTTYTNAAFLTYSPPTLSVPRMGVFASSTANATRPEADIDMYVAGPDDPNAAKLINLDPAVIENCVFHINGDGASLGRSGTEFVAYNNSALDDVYYIGVKAEDQEASEYGFIALFSQQPFSQLNPNGSQTVNGVALPVGIPDGNPALPGFTNVFGLALYPMEIRRVIVTNIIAQQNVGDLVSALTHSGSVKSSVILMNHDSPTEPGDYTFIYDDSGWGDIFGSQVADGPGSLNGFVGSEGLGPWILHEADSAEGFVGSVTGYNLLIEPHNDLTKGTTTMVNPRGWFYDYIDVPPGATNLTIYATNLTAAATRSPYVYLFVRFGTEPTLTTFDEMTQLTNSVPLGLEGSISIGPPLAPGRYWVGLYNGSVQPQTVYILAKLGLGAAPQATYTSAGAVQILDDAVTIADMTVPVDATVSTMEVALRVDHPRVSDLVFHLISPNGTRVLLVENRGGTTTNGMGATYGGTNVIPVSASGGPAAATNVINVSQTSGILTITYNFYPIPDEMVVYDQSGTQIFDSGMISGSGVFNIPYANSSTITIVMNPGGGLPSTGWDYKVMNAVQASYSYLVLTEDTNKTTTPIKFAPTPFVPVIPMTTNPPAAVGWHSSFEGNNRTNIGAGGYISEGWYISSGDIDVLLTGDLGSTAFEGTNYIDITGTFAGTITTNIPTVTGQTYVLTFTYCQNPGGPPAGYHSASVQLQANGSPLLTLTVAMTNSWVNLGWTTTSLLFTATSPLTQLTFQSLDPAGDKYGVQLDAIDLAPITWANGFEGAAAGDYPQGHYFDGWTVITNQVTVISNSVLARTGTNLLALADGQISRILPTVPGTKYTLSYAYRGPGIVSLWRGESNSVAIDSIGNNNGVFTNGVTFVTGKVGQGFNFNGTNQFVIVPDRPSLSFTQEVTMEFWYEDLGSAWASTGLFGKRPGPPTPCNYAINYLNAANILQLYFEDTSPSFQNSQSTWPSKGVFHHLAGSLRQMNATQVEAKTYIDGALVKTDTLSGILANAVNTVPVTIGAEDMPGYWGTGDSFHGIMDEVSLYKRALSASEIKAIYNHGSAGKYNTSAPSIALGLAEAQVSLNGATYPAFFGDNTNWQTAYITFTATQTNTPLQITGIEPGMLLDNFVMSQMPTNNYDLYYLPEQSLDTVAGENAQGDWRLEVQDDRAGAGLTNSLVSWQLRFIFTEPASTYTSLTNGLPLTNGACFTTASNIVYYTVYVPTNVDVVANIVFNINGDPVNLWFNQNTPPTGTGTGDYLLFGPAASGSANLTLAGTPPLVPGATYFLGVQNTVAGCSTNSIEVDFHFRPAPLALPQLPELIAYVDQLFTVINSATGGVPPYTYALTTTVPGPNVPVIDSGTGVITWTPTSDQAPAVYTFTNIVTDSTLPTALTATDIFNVLVVFTNVPAFPGAEGAGGFAIGGRGGDVYHVINVNDDGPGSLRYGIETTPGSRTIVFDVSGTITLFSDLKINRPYLTVAGQTAPGDGICLQGLLTSVEHTHDVQVRFLRCRPGDLYCPYFQDDSFHFYYVTNSIADHISASWSIDETLSTTDSTNVSVQWSMIAESLKSSCHIKGDHGYGSLIRYGSGAISYHHNLYADNSSRNPRPGDNIRLDFINNVIFNWGFQAGYNENDAADNPGGYTNYLNYIGNYLVAGSDTTTPTTAFRSGVPNAANTQIYQATNFIDSNPFNVDLNGIDTGWSMFTGNLTKLGSPTPMPEIPVTITNAPQAYEQVLDFVGASVAGATAVGTPAAGMSLLRDSVDTDIVAGVRNKNGQIIDTEAQVGGWPMLNPAPQPLDSDGDGLPDYWEITLAATGQTNMNPAVANNNHSNPDGYTDLEHYINWLAAPHALTVSNTPVAVDLYAIAGRTGNLGFSVTDGTNGTVALINTIATFTPSNNYFGFASFGFSVTNLDTSVGGTNLDNTFNVTVSVMVSATNIVTIDPLLTNGVPQTNSVPTNGIAYYLVAVPANADFATNILITASAPVNLLFSKVGFPTGANTGDYMLMNGQTNGISILSTTSMPTNIVPGGSYYLGVQNTGGSPVTFVIEVDFHYLPPPPPPAIIITSITATNIGGTNGFLLQWQGPTNYQYEIQWTTDLLPVIVWNTVLDPFINVVVTSTNGHYSWLDDGSLTGGPALTKFYRILGGLNLGPIIGPGPVTNTVLAGAMSQAVVPVPAIANSANNLLISATGPLNVWFNQTNPPTGNTNAGDFLMLSAATSGAFVLTSNSVPPLVPGANYYLGFQNPGTSNVTFVFEVAFGSAAITAVANFNATTTNGGIWLRWNGQTDYQYQVQWKTNLAPPTAWNTISNIVLTSTTGIFTFFDDGSLTGGWRPMKFYRLIAWPFMTPIPQTLSISSVTVTNIAGTNDLVLKWSAPTNYHYKIQWTTNLALPFSSWSIIASPVPTPANGVYTFIDNGQTGPPAHEKFFRLYVYP
jgi:subtilisin-like proprotein convertase family protein